jgi:hypothetical protein
MTYRSSLLAILIVVTINLIAIFIPYHMRLSKKLNHSEQLIHTELSS